CLIAIVVKASEPWTLGVPIGGAVAALAVFLGLLGNHEKVIREEKRRGELVKIQEEALARLARDWNALPLPNLPSTDSALARDLGLFGRASLGQLLGTARTPPGRKTLVAWLSTPAATPEIRARQEAVRELTPEIELRQSLELEARTMVEANPDIEPFLAWAEGEPWLLRRPFLLYLARFSAVATVVLLGFVFAGLVPFAVWSILPLLNFAFSFAVARPFHGSFDRVAARERDFVSYAALFRLLEGRRSTSPKLAALIEATTADGVSAYGQIDLLRRRLALADVRLSAPTHFVLQSLVLWDFHALERLERWQVTAGPRARGWLAALGEIETLAALATLAHDQPEWTFPEVLEAAEPAGETPQIQTLRAVDLGHPLLSDAERVGNDVAVGPPGTFLLVTGSNMSGKSTLLRSLGVNIVLAQAGGPVAARSLTLPPVTLGTSILVEDSLASGVSFFLAELQRIRSIVDQAEAARREGRTLLYLLDEILRGTNSAERQIAVREILLRLLAAGAIGAISTHDLALAELPELAEVAHTVHFRESFEDRHGETAMTFDYHLREGVAPTTNALKLLAMVGLGPR
ncbi:MAG TPA: DNA mismatch repair protein MutS, partial [Thermoanaerobaculia bacterium]|nr:DNA mismatch repair protein MutS [Thermoanaerobaculia bacterium]